MSAFAPPPSPLPPHFTAIPFPTSSSPTSYLDLVDTIDPNYETFDVNQADELFCIINPAASKDEMKTKYIVKIAKFNRHETETVDDPKYYLILVDVGLETVYYCDLHDVSLHALSNTASYSDSIDDENQVAKDSESEGEPYLYTQLCYEDYDGPSFNASGQEEDDDDSIGELHLFSTVEDKTEKAKQVERLFESLSLGAELSPTSLDEDEEGGSEGGGAFGSMMNMLGISSSTGSGVSEYPEGFYYNNEISNDDEAEVYDASGQFDDGEDEDYAEEEQEGEGATDEERQKALDRLDSLIV